MKQTKINKNETIKIIIHITQTQTNKTHKNKKIKNRNLYRWSFQMITISKVLPFLISFMQVAKHSR